MAKTGNSVLERTIDPEEAVFENPLLLENILQFVVTEGKEIQKTNLIAVRLVAKTWLQSASRLVKKSGQSVLIICLGDNENVNRVNFKLCNQTTKEVLDNLVSTFRSNSCLENSIITLHLNLEYGFFGNAINFQCLKNVLEQCGNILFSLNVNVSFNRPFIKEIFGRLELPNLSHLHFNLSDERVGAENTASSETTSSILKFLQVLLNGAKNMKCFEFMMWGGWSSAVQSFKSIRLPETVTEIKSCGSEFIWDYTILMNSHLPNLQEIRTNMFSTPTDEQMFEILDRFRTSLKFFYMNNRVCMDTGTITLLRFPLMEKLESILIRSENYELESNVKGALSKQLPNLRKLSIDGQNEQKLMQWIINSNYQNVHTLHLTENQENKPDVNSPSFEIMKGLMKAFPNVRRLSLNFNYEDIATLKLLFGEWTRLKSLELTFSGNVSVNDTSDLLASLFLGASKQKVQELLKLMQTSLDNACQSYNDADQGLNIQESIVNLAELTDLTLEFKLMIGLPEGVFDSLFDILTYAFKKMPNLVKRKLLLDKEPALFNY